VCRESKCARRTDLYWRRTRLTRLRDNAPDEDGKANHYAMKIATIADKIMVFQCWRSDQHSAGNAKFQNAHDKVSTGYQ